MILTTTDQVPGREIVEVVAIVSGEAVMGTNFFRDFLAGIRDIFGGRSGTYQRAMHDAKQAVLQEMAEEAKELGANAVVGITLLPYAIASDKDKMLAVSGSGTAVKVR